MTTFSIGIVGAGLGGLCLAQGLHKAGVEVVVVERDITAQIRDQGYRLRIDPSGQQALAQCLPAEQYRLFCATCAQNQGESRLLDPLLRPLNDRRPTHWLPSSRSQLAVPSGDLAANRQTLREILLEGLQDKVRFGQALSSFKETPEGVELHLAMGERICVDLLIAADGIHSSVRKQYLPQAEPENSQAITLYGKVPLSATARDSLDPAWLQSVSVIFANGFTLVVEPMIFQASMSQLAETHVPHCHLTPIGDYLYWAFIGSSSRLGAPSTNNSSELYERVQKLSQGWDVQLRTLLALSASQSLSARKVYVTQEMPNWPRGRVSFLGDAIHAMSPAGGLGANTALVDAARLTAYLTAAIPMQQGLAALRAYEDDMKIRARSAMQLSRQAADRLSLGGTVLT